MTLENKQCICIFLKQLYWKLQEKALGMGWKSGIGTVRTGTRTPSKELYGACGAMGSRDGLLAVLSPLSPSSSCQIRPVCCELISCSVSPFGEAQRRKPLFSDLKLWISRETFRVWAISELLWNPKGEEWWTVQCYKGPNGIQGLLYTLKTSPNPNLFLEGMFIYLSSSFIHKPSGAAGASKGIWVEFGVA